MVAGTFTYLKRTVEELFAELDHATRISLLCAFAALMAVGGWYLYRYVHHATQIKEHMILTDCMHQYEQALQGKTEWSDVIAMCEQAEKKYAGLAVAPYIMAVEVDALCAQYKPEEAIEKLTKVVTTLGVDSPVYYLYKTKLALLNLDHASSDAQSSALNELQALSANAANPFNDQAAYYLGLYYKSQGDNQKAREIWTPLVAINQKHTDTLARSAWASLAEEKMNGLA